MIFRTCGCGQRFWFCFRGEEKDKETVEGTGEELTASCHWSTLRPPSLSAHYPRGMRKP